MQLALAQGSRGPFGMQTGGFGTSMSAGKQLGEVKARPQVNRSRQHGKGNSGSGNSRSGNSRSKNSGPGNSVSGNSAAGNSAPGNSAPGSSAHGNSAPGNSPALDSGSGVRGGEGANGRGFNSGEDSSAQSSQSKAGLGLFISQQYFRGAVFRLQIRRSVPLVMDPDTIDFLRWRTR